MEINSILISHTMDHGCQVYLKLRNLRSSEHWSAFALHWKFLSCINKFSIILRTNFLQIKFRKQSKRTLSSWLAIDSYKCNTISSWGILSCLFDCKYTLNSLIKGSTQSCSRTVLFVILSSTFRFTTCNIKVSWLCCDDPDISNTFWSKWPDFHIQGDHW